MTIIPYFLFVSNNWHYFAIAPICFLLFLLFSIWILPESPRQWLTFGNVDKAIASFDRIAKLNDATSEGLSDELK